LTPGGGVVSASNNGGVPNGAGTRGSITISYYS
jgi:hypothetical protein